METNEIMKNEEVIETVTNEISTEVKNVTGLKIATGIGLSVLVGFIAYKYVAKPIIANIKAKKTKVTEDDIIVDEVDDFIDEVETPEEGI